MLSFICISALLGLGHLLRSRIRVLQRLFLPSSIVAGFVGLFLLQVAIRMGHPLPEACTAGWGRLPGLLINVVFAGLFMGVALPKAGEIWGRAGRQLAYGQIVAWGQYLVAGLLVLLVLGPIWKVSPLFAGVLPVGFEGGHGTAGGMGPVFEDLGWADGKDLALASATIGILSALLVGMALVNWAARRGHVQHVRPPVEGGNTDVILVHERLEAGRLPARGDDIESLSMQLVALGSAIALGWLMKQGLLLFEASVPWLAAHGLFKGFPLFPLCMLGGLIIQWIDQRRHPRCWIDPGLMRRIQNAALDFLVVAAVATIRIEVVLAGWLPLSLLAAAGIAWNVLCVMWLARRVFKAAWFERAIAELGQSMGVTATGLLLLRVVDPDYKTPAADAFAAKQLMHEPFMGGGLWTGLAIPLIATVGLLPVTLIAATAIAAWSVILFLTRRHGQ